MTVMNNPGGVKKRTRDALITSLSSVDIIQWARVLPRVMARARRVVVFDVRLEGLEEGEGDER